MEFFFGAALFDHDLVKNRSDQSGIDAVFEGKLLLQCGTDFP